ncbi:MAG: M24 family metallopeptidase [Thermotogota bacterium]
MKERIEKLVKSMIENEISQYIISSTEDIFYFTGEWIESGERLLTLLIDYNSEPVLIVNKLFPIENSDLQIIFYDDSENPIDLLSRYIKKNKNIAIDKNWPSKFLIKLLSKKEFIPKDKSELIEELRMIKSSDEIKKMKASSRLNDDAIEEVINLVPEMLPEKYLARAAENIINKIGFSGVSFSPLVAFGGNCGEPHHESDFTKIKNGDSVIIDMGGIKNRYCSDMTRTVFYGEPGENARKVYDIVLQANLKAIESVKPGMKFSDIDLAARNIIEKHGYGKFFTHRTGHSIGIEVHEWPYVSKENDMIVKPGMIFSIEPGIYIPNQFGVRIEDLVLVTENGVEVLNNYTKEMQIL